MQPTAAREVGRDIKQRHRQAINEYRVAVRFMGEQYGLPGFKEAVERAEAARIRYFEIREELRQHYEALPGLSYSKVLESMNPSGAALLANPQPCGHIVYPYTDEAHVVEAVCLFASSGLSKGEAVILVMSAAHCDPIRQRLEAEGLNLAELERTGRLVCKDAKNLLSTFLADGKLDEVKFKTAVGDLIEKAKVASGHPGNQVRVFGEMVDLLWKDDLQNTHRLEELWNEVIEAHSVPLLCAYSLAGIKPSAFPAALLSCHSHTIAATT